MIGFNKASLEIIKGSSFGNTMPGAPKFIDRTSIAHRIGVRTRTLTNLIMHREERYQKHIFPKKSGGFRLVYEPEDRLKYVQTQILRNVFDVIEYPDHITAYVPGRSITHAAKQHAGRPLLAVIDLKDFFPSTRRAWVRRMWQEEFGYPWLPARVLADITTVPDSISKRRVHLVPQGSPTSGAVCNWVAHNRFDKTLLELCANSGFVYTRYADDLAFSHGESLPRKEVDAFLSEVRRVIYGSGYRVNHKKTRVLRRGSQQRLLGMVINDKPNVVRKQYKQVRARIHHIKHKGLETVAKEMNISSAAKLKRQLDGVISFYNMVSPDKALKLQTQLEEALQTE